MLGHQIQQNYHRDRYIIIQICMQQVWRANKMGRNYELRTKKQSSQNSP